MDLLSTLRTAENISNNEKEVRDYILAHPQEILHMTITQLAKASYTSPATVTRLCHKIGVDGFTPMKLTLAAELSKTTNEHYKKDLNENDISSPADKVTLSTLNAIHATRSLYDQNSYYAAAKLIDEAPVLDFFGNGTSGTVAQEAAYMFERIGKACTFFTSSDRQKMQAMMMNSSHVAIVISYGGASKIISEISSTLKKREISQIAITTADSPLAGTADIVLPTSRSEPILRTVSMSSRITQFYVVDILFNICFDMHYDEYIKNIDNTVFL